MPYFNPHSVESPFGGKLSLDLDSFNDLLDYQTRIALYPMDDQKKKIVPPGLWYGEQIAQRWRRVAQIIENRDDPVSQSKGMEPVDYRLTILMLSDNTVQNLLSGAMQQGLNLLDKAADNKLGLGTRTCYDDLAELYEIFKRKDKKGQKQIWRLESWIGTIFHMDTIEFLDLSVTNPQGSETMMATLTFAPYKATPLIGEGF